MRKSDTNTKLLVTEKMIKHRTLISFGCFALFVGLGIFAWQYVKNQPKDEKGKNLQQSFRSVLNANESVFSTLMSPGHMAKTFPKSEAVKKVRVNGNVGMNDDFDAELWKLKLVRREGDTLLISLDELKRLPKTEIVFDFKCIEGWSQVTHWGGVKFSDFMTAYNLKEQTKMNYLGLSTPDDAYYVGIDMPSAIHSQTLLCYEMNGEALPMKQGFPLRLIIPVKYGIKSLKRIGTLFFSNGRPRDYWYERGYDYYSGL